MPPAAAPAERLKAIARLNDAGIPAGVTVGPVVPGLTDQEIPRILAAAADAARGSQGPIYPPAASPTGHDTPVPPSPQ